MRHIAKSYSMQPLVYAVVSAAFCYAFFNVSNPVVLAGPEGAEVIHGQVSFQQNGLNTVITASDKSIVNYKSFNIARPEAVEFVQPHSNASVLNRILSANPTYIDGTLSANGRVFFVNPAGVYIGNGAKINVNQLVASGLNISNSDFINGKYLFEGGHGSVVNRGDISAEKVHLIGKQVANYGTINCPGGYVVMAVGDRVFLGKSGNDLTVEVDTEPLPEPAGLALGVRNEGTINAAGGEIVLAAAGDIYSQAISNVGTLSASIRAGDAGEVKLIAEKGKVINSGSITATSNSGTGGTVQVLGNKVDLLDGTEIDASGSKGGGTVLIGGDYQGKGDIPTASRTYVSPDSNIKADATENGDGGKVVVWSDEATYYSGDISARGGPEGGDGGFVEVSGGEQLGFNGYVDTLAQQGRNGTLLLDPENIVIEGSDGTSAALSDVDNFDDFGTILTITEKALETTSSDVTLQARDSIIVTGTFGYDGNGEGTGSIVRLGDGLNLSMETENAPGKDIGGINLTGVEFQTQGSGNITMRAAIAGDGTGGAGSAPIKVSELTTLGSGSITLEAKGDIAIDGALTTADVTKSGEPSGSIIVTSSDGAIKVNAPMTTGDAIVVDEAGASQAISGDIKLSAGTSISGSGKVQTGDAKVTGEPGTGKDTATSGSIVLTSGTAGTTGEISLDNANALVIGEASRTGTGANGPGPDETKAGSIILTSDDKIYSGMGKDPLKVKINPAVGGAPNNNKQGLLDVTTNEDAGSVYISSDSALGIGTFNTKDATAQTVDITVTGFNQTLAVSQSSDLDADTVTLTADKMVIDGMLTTTDRVTVRPNSAGEVIDLGSTTDAATNTLELSDKELNNITAATLVIGDPDKVGAITFSSDVSLANVMNLHLLSSSTITGTAGGVAVGGLAVQAAGSVNITGSTTNVDTLAINTSTGDIQFKDADGFSVGTVDNISGVDTDSGSVALTATTGDVDLNAAVTGTTLVDIDAGADVTIAELVTGGQIDIDAGRDVLFDGAAGALRADSVVTIDAGTSIANTASTATNTIKTTTAGNDVTLTPANNTTPSTQAFAVDSAGAFTLAGPMSGTTFTIDAVDNVNIDGSITGTTLVDLTSSTANVEIDATIITTGGIFTSSGVDFDNTNGTIITDGGAVDIQNTGNVTIGAAINTGAGNVDIDGGDEVAMSIIDGGGTISSSGTITLEASGSIGGSGAAITTAGTGTINASSTVSGDIYIDNTGNVTLGTVNTTASDIMINNAGNILIGSITAGGNGKATINSTIGSIDDSASDTTTDITAGTVDLDAATGIGATRELETATTSISADTTNGNIDIDNIHASDVTATSLTTGSGNILFSQAGSGNLEVAKATTTIGSIGIDVTGANLTALTVTAGGTGKNLALTTTTSGDVLVCNVAAADDQIVINSAGAVAEAGSDAEADITTGTLVINAVSGVGSADALETQVGFINIDNSTSGDIQIDEVTTGGALGINNVKQDGAGKVVIRTLDGTLMVEAGQTGVSAKSGETILDARDAGTSGDNDLVVKCTVTSISGKINLDASDDVIFGADGDVTSTSGEIEVAANDAINMVDGTVINAGDGTITFSADGDIALGQLVTTNNNASAVALITTGGAVTSAGDTGGKDIVAKSSNALVTINAKQDIGTANNAIKTDVTALSTHSGNGGIVIVEKDNIEIELASAGNGNVQITAGGDVTQSGRITANKLTVDTGSSPAGSATGAIILNTQNNETFTINMTSGNDMDISYKDVDGVDIELASAGKGDVKITAGGNVTQSGRITANKLTVDTGSSPAGSATGAIVLNTQSNETSTINMTSGNDMDISYKDVDGVDIELANAGTGDVQITAGGDVTDTGAITAGRLTVDADIGAGGSIVLDLDATHDADTVKLTSPKDGQNIIYKDKDDVDIESADAGNGDVQITAGGNVTQSGKITANKLTVDTGSSPAGSATGAIILDTQNNETFTINMTSGNDMDISYKDVDGVDIELADAGNGDVQITAGGDVTDSGPITANKLTVNTDVGTGGSIVLDLDTAHDADIVELTSKSGRNIVYKDKNNVMLGDILAETGNIFLEATNGEMTGGKIKAGGGSLTMRQRESLNTKDFTFDNQVGTDLTLESTNGSVTADNVKASNAADKWRSITAKAKSNIELRGTGNIEIGGDLTSDSGGVSIRSDTGRITFTDVVKNITGFSNTSGTGVDLPDGPGKAAIVIMSKSDLKLGSGITLEAKGEYRAYDSAHDDRSSINFQNIGDKAGDPIDVAIYVGSYDFESETGGNVTVNSTVSMATNGTMVVDAGNTVNSFGNKFIESHVWKDKTNRLEVVSRTTQTVDQAVDKKTLPHAVEARRDEPPDWFYGEQYVLRGKPIAEILAKVGPVPLVPPLPAEPEEQGEVEEADTKELIRWLEEEGITPYLAEAYPDTLNTDVRLIKAAKRLRDCAKILEDMTCAQFERLVRILDGHIPEPTYLAQVDGHQVKVLHRDDAVIAVLSGEWAQALACYVEVCTDEFYMPYDRAVKSCMRKYVNVIEKEPTISEDQDLIINLLEYVHKSANSLKSDSSIYWTEDST